MAEWYVYKTGQLQFDQLHAFGLAFLLACITKEVVLLDDLGHVYQLVTSEIPQGFCADKLWETLWPLPKTEDLTLADDLSLSVFDGLLILLFTTPGTRLISVFDVQNKVPTDPEIIGRGLKKVKAALNRFLRFLQYQSGKNTFWIDSLLSYYQKDRIQDFSLRAKKGNQLSLLMTIDPFFSHASRQPINSLVEIKTCNVFTPRMPYAPFLAYLGASRELRAQRVKGHIVNLYLLIYKHAEITMDSHAPLLSASQYGSIHSRLIFWLQSWQESSPGETGFAYQSLQTLGVSQSISVDQGYFDFEWLNHIQKNLTRGLIRYWLYVLRVRSLTTFDKNERLRLDRLPNSKVINGQALRKKEIDRMELDLLLDALSSPKQANVWLPHLMDHARCILSRDRDNFRPYHLNELQEIYILMDQKPSLSAVLAKPKGTPRFGHALRLLGEFRPTELLEISEGLDTVCNQYGLLRVLAEAMQQCVIAKAKNDFIIIPDDKDLALLLDDIALYGVKDIAGLLIILSTLRYPTQEKESS